MLVLVLEHPACAAAVGVGRVGMVRWRPWLLLLLLLLVVVVVVASAVLPVVVTRILTLLAITPVLSVPLGGECRAS